MLVDEYHDTSWTRGQYPAAPPYRLDQRIEFIFKIEKQPPASSGCFQKSGVLQFLFIFGLCITFLFRSYPYNKLYKCLCQQYFYKKLGKKYHTFYNLLSNLRNYFSNGFYCEVICQRPAFV